MSRLINIALLVTISVGLLWLLGCEAAKEDTKDPVVAQVGEEKLYASELKMMVEGRKAMVQKSMQENITPELVMDDWIDVTLIAQEAKRRGLDKDEQVQKQLDDYLNGLLGQKMWETEIEAKVDSVTEEEIMEFYETIKEGEYKTMYPKMRMSLLTVKGLAEAEGLVERARAGEDFAKLVQEYSIRKDLGPDGDMGYRRKEELPDKLSGVAFSMKVGEVSDPIKFEVGYSVIEITGKVEAGEYIPLGEKEKAQLYERTLLEKRKQYATEFISELKKNTTVFKFLHKYQEAIEAPQE